MRNIPDRPLNALPIEPSTSYQCLLASAVQQVDKVAAIEQVAEEAALSLAQRERVAALTAETRALRSTLVEAADARARALLTPRTTWLERMKARVAAGAAGSGPAAMHWGPALQEARRVVTDAAECLRALGSSLPDGEPAAQLTGQVDGVLRRHQEALGLEIERWAA